MNRCPGVVAVSLVVVGFVAGLAFEPARLSGLVPRAHAADARASVGAPAKASEAPSPHATVRRGPSDIETERAERDELRLPTASRAGGAVDVCTTGGPNGALDKSKLPHQCRASADVEVGGAVHFLVRGGRLHERGGDDDEDLLRDMIAVTFRVGLVTTHGARAVPGAAPFVTRSYAISARSRPRPTIRAVARGQ